MNVQNYDVACLPREIVLGRQTETGVMTIRIDCAAWLNVWPHMEIRLLMALPGRAARYAITHRSGTELVWPITDADTARAGRGTLEIIGDTGSTRKLSDIVSVVIR